MLRPAPPSTLPFLLLALLPAGASAAPGEPNQTGDAQPMLPVTSNGMVADELSAAYRSLYLAFAGADRATAIAEAARFERDTLAAEPKKGFDKLSAADSRLFEAIADASPRSLLALGLFYENLAFRHFADKSWGLALRANNATEELLRRVAIAAKSDEDRAVASAAYQGFAADLLDNLATGRAIEMLEKATLLVPDDAGANLALAILMQREERYPVAALRLDRAIAADPGLREARLRRAMIAVRDDAGNAANPAIKELEELSASPEGDWICIVATQERGRLLLASQKYERAIAWFAAAADRFPTEHSFRTAQSFAQSRLGRRNAAAISARAALKAPRDEGESARRRFSDSPVRVIAPRRVEARAAAESRWDGLRVALGAVTPVAAPGGGEARQ